MKIDREQHGNAGTIHIGDHAIPIRSWSLEYHDEGSWRKPRDVMDWATGNVRRLTRNARRLLRKRRERRS